MRPTTSTTTTTEMGTWFASWRRPARLVAAIGVAGALIVSSSCASSSDTKAVTTTVPAGSNADPAATNVTGSGGVIDFRTLDAGGPQTIGALKNGSIDIAELFTFTPEIAANNWVTLEDDKHLQAADNFVPLINASKNTPQITAVIDAVTAKLNHDDLMAMVEKVSVDGADPEDVAEDWLKANKLPGNLKATGKLTIGSANFAESEIVGRLYSEALDDAGVDTTFKDSVGNRQVTMPMMEKGDIDLMPEFTYSLLAFLDSAAKPSNDLDAVVTQLKAALPSSLEILTPSDVSDVNVFVVTAETAKKHNLAKISDLANVTDTLTMGGPPECPKNAACIPGLEKVYGLRFNIK